VLGFHDLRHAFASLLIRSGGNPLEMQTQMGHASISETFGTYGHLFPGGTDDLLARADAVLDETRLRVVR
jgi:integrase